MFHERSKHIDVRRHFIRDEIQQGSIDVVKVPTEENASDMLTKALPVSKFKHCLDLDIGGCITSTRWRFVSLCPYNTMTWPREWARREDQERELSLLS